MSQHKIWFDVLCEKAEKASLSNFTSQHASMGCLEVTEAIPVVGDYISLIVRNRPFFLLWVAAIISQLGDWFNEIALLKLASMYTGNTAILLALVLISRELPPLLLGPFVGIGIIYKLMNLYFLIIYNIFRISC